MTNPEKINNEVTQKVAIVGLNKIPADFYLYQKLVTVVLSSPTAIDDQDINVVDASGVITGNVITFFEGTWIFQNIVKAVNDNVITLASLIDHAFTTAAKIEAGIWNMAVNGSVTKQRFSFIAPIEGIFNIKTINVSMLDSSSMDDGLFGGITALTNGLVWRVYNGITKHLAVIINNLGFKEIGFTIEYSDKAPAGQYGLFARRNIDKINGTILYLKNSGKFEICIQDNLTDLDLMAITINGHLI